MTADSVRTDSGSPATISQEAHRVYRALVDGLLMTGEVPGLEGLAEATGLQAQAISPLQSELANQGWTCADATGSIAALYPFSPAPTGIQVRIDGVHRHAMCAIDALGVAPMLDRPVVVSTTCAVTGQPLEIEVTPTGIAAARPATITVIRRSAPGTARASCCGETRFYQSISAAEIWLGEHGAGDDLITSVDTAFELATVRFGACYSGDGLPADHAICNC